MAEEEVGDVKDLEAIDIFLFSNGDHNTPPRKYHLNTDTFVMWDDTLKSLGRSHFGIDPKEFLWWEIYSFYRSDLFSISVTTSPLTYKGDTVIDIYTITGHKIDDPSQLIHQAAYVAVKPPTAFIQTGYENYLIRATRSWEKRLLKITNSMDSSTKGNTESVSLKSQLNKENYGHEKKNEISNPAVVEKLKQSLVRPYIVDLKAPQGREKISKIPELKHIQRKKTPQIALRQRSSPFKLTSASKKVLIKTKGEFHKKLPDLKKLVLATPKEKKINNTIKGNQDNQIFSSNNIINVVDNVNVTESANRSGEKISSVKKNHQNADNKKKNVEKIVISNIYKNPEKEYLSMTGIKYDDAPNVIDETKSLSYADTKCIKTYCTCCNNKSSKKSITHAENKTNTEISDNDTISEVPVEIQTCVNCCETRKQLNNFVAILNNDKVLKLHLNLEIKDCSVSLMSDQFNAKTTHETQACISIIKTEKETQVNFYEQLNEEIYDDVNKTEYILQHSDDELKDIIKDENKIVIINCSCCDCLKLHRLQQLNIKYKNAYNEDILYELATAIEANRCECRNDVQNNQLNGNPSPKIATNNYEECEEKTLTVTSVQKLLCSHETNTCNDNLNSDEFPKLIVAIDEYSNQMSNVSKKKDIVKKYVNSSTQTNWYNIMLEARHRTDGRYSFHLPPLYKIKNYNID